MAIIVGDNFNYQGKKPNFTRDSFATLALMATVADSIMDDGHIAYCQEDGKTYKFVSTNEVDATTGKWREFGAGQAVDDTLQEDALAGHKIGPFSEGSGLMKGAPLNTLLTDLMADTVPAPNVTAKVTDADGNPFKVVIGKAWTAQWQVTINDLNNCKLQRYEIWSAAVDVSGTIVSDPARTGFNTQLETLGPGSVMSNGITASPTTAFTKTWFILQYTDANDVPRVVRFTEYIHNHGQVYAYLMDDPIQVTNGSYAIDDSDRTWGPFDTANRYDIYEGDNEFVFNTTTPKYITYMNSDSNTQLLELTINGINYLERGSLISAPVSNSYALFANRCTVYQFPIPVASQSDIVLTVKYQKVLDNIDEGTSVTIVNGGTGVSEAEKAKWNSKLNYTVNEPAEQVQFTAG